MKNSNYIFILIIVTLFFSCKTEEEKLLQYVTENDFEKLEELIINDSLINLNIKNEKSSPLCFISIDNENSNILELLLKNNIDTRLINKDSLTVLGYSLMKNNVKAVEIILKYDTLANTLCYKSMYPLHLASSNGNLDIVTILLKKRANINQPDSFGNTPIFYASDLETFKLFIENNADCSHTNQNGQSLKKNAKLLGYNDVCNYLNSNTEIIFKNKKTASKPRRETSFKSAIKHITKRKIVPAGVTPTNTCDYQTNFIENYNYKYLFISDTVKLIKSDYNAFLFALELAYYEERPIVITPDMIWLLICQGVSQHINLNHEKLRDKFVNFAGKKRITINGNLPEKDDRFKWNELINNFVKQTNENLNDSLYNIMSTGFTSTTVVEKIVFSITYLDVLKNYFEYFNASCGIPSITIEGTVQDWKKIENNVELFRKYNLEWWIDNLKPCLKQFVDASSGKIDTVFWRSILKNRDINSCDDDKLVTGWATNFFPYIYTQFKDKKVGYYPNMIIVKNPDIERKEKVGFAYENVLSGISIVPFINTNGNSDTKMEFTAGFVGIEQDRKTMKLKPKIGYGIIKK